MTQESKAALTILDTPVLVEPSALLTPLTLFGLGMRLAPPPAGWLKRLRIGVLTALAYEITSLIHMAGHVYSARYAQAPVDQYRLCAPLPQTLYFDNDVSPRTHVLRSAGGLLSSGIAFLLALFLRRITLSHSLPGEVVDLLCITNGAIFAGSFYPLPFIDGGVILKWWLVERGQSEREADATVRRTNMVASMIMAVATLFWLLIRRRGDKV